MEFLFVLIASFVVGGGLYATYLLTVVSRLQDQLELAQDMIIAMATELESLGSKNVAITKDSK
jgi:hypothetical protein